MARREVGEAGAGVPTALHPWLCCSSTARRFEDPSDEGDGSAERQGGKGWLDGGSQVACRSWSPRRENNGWAHLHAILLGYLDTVDH